MNIIQKISVMKHTRQITSYLQLFLDQAYNTFLTIFYFNYELLSFRIFFASITRLFVELFSLEYNLNS